MNDSVAITHNDMALIYISQAKFKGQTLEKSLSLLDEAEKWLVKCLEVSEECYSAFYTFAKLFEFKGNYSWIHYSFFIVQRC